MDDLNTQPVADQLTQREKEILHLITDGLSNQQVAEQLVVTVGTVKWYLKQIYSKLGVNSRTQAIAASRTLSLRDTTQDQLEPVSLKHNLPLQSTPFIGRTDELADIAERLRDPACRVLTLVGPGGIG